MLNTQLNVFENFPVLHGPLSVQNGNRAGTLVIHGVVIPGSISFNQIAMLINQGNTSRSMLINIGLYSYSGSTLSLANSASANQNFTANGVNWITLATSAAQNITPGNWWFAFLFDSATASNSIVGTSHNFSAGGIGGPFIHGFLSVTTNALPTSIATSDLSPDGSSTTNSDMFRPYILISA